MDDQARLDVAASGISGGQFQRTFIDVRVFNPYASSNRSKPLAACYAKHEKEKKRTYEQRIQHAGHAPFVPAVFSTSGGMSKCASALYKRIACLLSAKFTERYSAVIAHIRCRLSFALLRSCTMCLCGARSIFTPAAPAVPAELVVAEAGVELVVAEAGVELVVAEAGVLAI